MRITHDDHRLSRGKPDRRQRDEPPCVCGHYVRHHEHIWDGESGKRFWFCHECRRQGKVYPDTHHNPKLDTPVADAHPEEPQDVFVGFNGHFGLLGVWTSEAAVKANTKYYTKVTLQRAALDAGGRVAQKENHDDEASRVAPLTAGVDGQELPQRSERVQSPLPSGRNEP